MIVATKKLPVTPNFFRSHDRSVVWPRGAFVVDYGGDLRLAHLRYERSKQLSVKYYLAV